MKTLTTYYPANSSDTLVTITATSSDSVFTSSNLKVLEPVKSWKSTSIAVEQIIKYNLNSTIRNKVNCLFLNRFNFAEFYVEYSTNDSTWTEIAHVSGQTKDEIADENYMHYWLDITNFNYQYIRLRIPAQTPLFETTYFKVGNMLIGLSETIWNPKAGYSNAIIPKMAIVEYDSGYQNVYKLGRIKRSFTGEMDKISTTEFNKVVKTFQPFVFYQEFDSDPTKAYLVRVTKEFARQYQFTTIQNLPFQFEEIV